jgi:hypothetical protein
MDLVRDPAVSLHEAIDRLHVGALRLVDLALPCRFELLVANDRGRNDEMRLRLVDVSLRELRIGEARAMPNELVGKGAAHAFEEDRVVRVLEDAAMALSLDVLEIILRRAARGIPLAHVAETTGKLGETLAAARVTQPLDGKMGRLRELRTRYDGESGL